MSENQPLPAHIRQLVDKKNYVIAIKTLATEQGVSLEDAKKQIDAYELQATHSSTSAVPSAGLTGLSQSLDSHLQQENIKVPLIPRYVWRIGVIVVVMAIIGGLIYQLF